MSGHGQVLKHFLDRLAAGISRSLLLRVRVTKTGRLLDCSRLQAVVEGLPYRLLDTVLKGEKAISIDLRLRAGQPSRAPIPAGRATTEPAEEEPVAREHQQLHHLLDKRMRRHAELAKRETGVHALWLGYPLLYGTVGEGDSKQWILAPVFLWPASVTADLRHEGRIRIGRATDAGPVQFNRSMALWIRRYLGVQLPAPSEENLQELDWQALKEHLGTIANCFTTPPDIDCEPPLEAIPSAKSLEPKQGPCLYNAAVLGYFRWQNEAILADLEAIKGLPVVDGPVEGFTTGKLFPKPPDVPPPPEEDRFLVSEADFSQEKVLWQARQAPGVVVHGPPGTGKSQTIVNIIADALAHGQTVLMVCQKQAATRVVLERLRAAGLADLCLEVHDPESDRRAVFNAIREQAENLPHAAPAAGQQRRRELSQRIAALENDLDQFARALHGLQPCGMSYRRMKAEEGRLYDSFRQVRQLPALQGVVAKFTAEQLDDLCGRVEKVGGLFRQADPLRNPWRFRQPGTQASAALRADVLTAVEDLRRQDARHVEHVRTHGAGLPLVADVCGLTENELVALAAHAEHLIAYSGKRWRFLAIRYHRARKALRPLLQGGVTSGGPECRRQAFEEARRSISRAPLVKVLLNSLAALEPFLTARGIEEPRSLALQGQPIAVWLDGVVRGLEGLPSLMALDADRQKREGPIGQVLSALEDYEARLAGGEKGPAPPPPAAGEYGRWWAALVKYTAYQVWQGRCDAEHPVLLEMTPEAHAEKVRQLASLLREKRGVEAEAIRALWLARQVQNRARPWKRMFQLRQGKLGDAKRLREAVDLSLPNGLLAMRPCWLVNPGAAAQIFPLGAGLFDLVIFDEASQCPIEQAVPVIYRGKRLVVSGDEKQLPPTSFFSARAGAEEGGDEEAEEEATTKVVDQRQERLRRLGIADLIEVKDLLQAAVDNLPELFLRVHYRSEHPALIQFSNHAFYGGQLEAPPSRTSSRDGFRPIEYVNANGCYVSGIKVNRQEAGLVIQTLRKFWLDGGTSPTIGVVTFNQPQRELIEDLIAEECRRDESFAARYQQELDRKEANQDVGFFVKNLENVQGDEREVMVFSTTFGPDAEGRFYRRFGPVGAEGGERRLNVAITRAKRQVIVISSMPVEQISTALKAGAAPGSHLTPACYLQLYLAYAEAVAHGSGDREKALLGRLADQSLRVRSVRNGPESPFEEDVLRAVEGLGFVADCQVGDSGFRIDFGILHPEPERGYVLGIECDGATYHSDRAARSRDVWRESILTRHGWRLHRIWSTRWWYNRVEEVEKLKAAVEEALASSS